jgi:NitT/TauT family transport system substrate-binding protein
MTAYLRGLRAYNDAFGPTHKGRAEVVQMLVKDTTVKDPQLYDQMRPPALDPNGTLDVDYLQFELNYNKKSASIDLAKLIDTSFQEYAAQQLGPY